MTERKETSVKTKKPKKLEITFRCQRCGTLSPLEDMRSVTRFNPVLIVCKKCEKELR